MMGRARKRPGDLAGRTVARIPVGDGPAGAAYVRRPRARWSTRALAAIVAAAVAVAAAGTALALRAPQVAYEAERALPQAGLCTANVHQLLLPDRRDIISMHERGEYAIGHMVDGVWTVERYTRETMTDEELAVWDRIYGVTDGDRRDTWIR